MVTKRTTTKKPTAKKSIAKKPTPKKTVAKKPAVKKIASKPKTTIKKTVPKPKTTVKKAPTKMVAKKVTTDKPIEPKNGKLDFNKFVTSDYQNRGPNYPKSGIPIDMNIYRDDPQTLNMSFKNTSQKDAEEWAKRFIRSKGGNPNDYLIYSRQTGDYKDDWVEVFIEETRKPENKKILSKPISTSTDYETQMKDLTAYAKEHRIEEWHYSELNGSKFGGSLSGKGFIRNTQVHLSYSPPNEWGRGYTNACVGFEMDRIEFFIHLPDEISFSTKTGQSYEDELHWRRPIPDNMKTKFMSAFLKEDYKKMCEYVSEMDIGGWARSRQPTPLRKRPQHQQKPSPK